MKRCKDCICLRCANTRTCTTCAEPCYLNPVYKWCDCCTPDIKTCYRFKPISEVYSPEKKMAEDLFRQCEIRARNIDATAKMVIAETPLFQFFNPKLCTSNLAEQAEKTNKERENELREKDDILDAMLYAYAHKKMLEELGEDTGVNLFDYMKGENSPMDDKFIHDPHDSGKREEAPTGAKREPNDAKGRYDLLSPYALKRIALRYQFGSEKYGDRNWEKGLSWSRCIDSAKRHIDQFLMGMTDEDHLAAACWNLMALMHYQELGMTEMDDLPSFVGHHWQDELKAKLKKMSDDHPKTPMTAYFNVGTEENPEWKEVGPLEEVSVFETVKPECKDCACYKCAHTESTCPYDAFGDKEIHCWEDPKCKSHPCCPMESCSCFKSKDVDDVIQDRAREIVEKDAESFRIHPITEEDMAHCGEAVEEELHKLRENLRAGFQAAKEVDEAARRFIPSELTPDEEEVFEKWNSLVKTPIKYSDIYFDAHLEEDGPQCRFWGPYKDMFEIAVKLLKEGWIIPNEHIFSMKDGDAPKFIKELEEHFNDGRFELVVTKPDAVYGDYTARYKGTFEQLWREWQRLDREGYRLTGFSGGSPEKVEEFHQRVEKLDEEATDKNSVCEECICRTCAHTIETCPWEYADQDADKKYHCWNRPHGTRCTTPSASSIGDCRYYEEAPTPCAAAWEREMERREKARMWTTRHECGRRGTNVDDEPLTEQCFLNEALEKGSSVRFYASFRGNVIRYGGGYSDAQDIAFELLIHGWDISNVDACNETTKKRFISDISRACKEYLDKLYRVYGEGQAAVETAKNETADKVHTEMQPDHIPCNRVLKRSTTGTCELAGIIVCPVCERHPWCRATNKHS